MTAMGSGVPARCGDAFIGRDDDVAAVVAALKSPASIVSVYGQSGIGKSRLLAEAVGAVESQLGQDAVVHLDCADARGVEEILARIGELAGAPSHFRAPAGAVPDLDGRDLVVVLDQVDHVRRDLPDALAALTSQDGPRCLTASVLPLPPATALIGLEPLETPRSGAPDFTAAMALLVARITDLTPGFEVDDANRQLIADLVRSLGGVPLAIELAAARHSLLGLDELVRLTTAADRAPEVLGGRSQDRSTSMTAALEWTIRHLAPEDRSLLATLAVFAGDVDTTVIAQVHDRELSAVLDSLTLLVDLRLVESIPGPANTLRFRLRPLVAHAARPDLLPATERDLRSRHALHYAGAARRGAELVLDGRDEEVDPSMTRDLGEVRLASEWLQKHGDPSAALRCAADLTCLLQPQFAVHRVRLLLRSLFADTSGPDDLALAAARIAAAASELAVANGPDEVQHALELWQQGFDAVAEHDLRLALWAHAIRVRTLPVTGDFAGAASSAQAGLELSVSLGHPVWQARFEAWAGMVHHVQRDFRRAVELGERALRRSLTTGDRYAQIRVGMLLHQIPPEEWDGDPMLPPMEVLLEHARDLGDLSAQRWLLGNLAIATVLAGDHPAATRWQAESLAMVREDREAAIGLHATLVWAAVQGDHHAVARLRGASKPWEEVGLGSLPPRAIDRFREGVAAAVEALGPAAFDALLAEGAQASIKTNIQYARDLVAQPRPAASPEPDESTRESVIATLSPREQQVLMLLVGGYRNKEIADRLGTSAKTVMHHTSAIYRKLDVRGRAEAAALAVREGLAPSG